MNNYKCKYCNSELSIYNSNSELQKTIKCPSCDSEQTLPKIKNIEREEAYAKAMSFWRDGNFAEALDLYYEISSEDNTDAEAYWQMLLCKYEIGVVKNFETGKFDLTSYLPGSNEENSILEDELYKKVLELADDKQRPIYESKANRIDQILRNSAKKSLNDLIAHKSYWIALIIVIIAAAIKFPYGYYYDYYKAERLRKLERFDEAIDIFKKLNKRDEINKCKKDIIRTAYNKALFLLKEDKYLEFYFVSKKIKMDYQNTLYLFDFKEYTNPFEKDMITKAYEKAIVLAKSNKYEDAAFLFSLCYGYGDSAEKIKECNQHISSLLDSCIKKLNIEMVVCQAGSFIMGASGDKCNKKYERETTITRPFAIGKYEITQEQYKSIMGVNPSKFNGNNNPVDNVSWDEAKEFCDKLNEKYSFLLPKYYKICLPTEAQWEYACRGGTNTDFNNGENIIYKYYNKNSCTVTDDGVMEEIGWNEDNSGNKTHKVGMKKPNSFGIYDMHGNVWEWCRDTYNTFYKPQNGYDPLCEVENVFTEGHSLRGGSCNSVSSNCASYNKKSKDYFLAKEAIGFRIAIAPIQ